MRIHLASVPVDDQQKALRFYTETLGFELKHNIPLGEHAWITVVSEEAPEGTQLVLEPDGHRAVRPYKEALVEDGIPWTSFAVDDVEAEHERLTERGVRFVQPPTDLGTVITAILDDTCGNLIQIQKEKRGMALLRGGLRVLIGGVFRKIRGQTEGPEVPRQTRSMRVCSPPSGASLRSAPAARG